jgi:galactokinase
VTSQPLYFPEYGLGLLLIDTGVPNTLTLAEYASRWDEVAAASAALGVANLREVADAPHALRRVDAIDDPVLRSRARHVVTEIERVRIVAAELSGTAPAHERFVTIGKAMYRAHASLEIDYELSNPRLDRVVDSAFRAGALGARLVEGGFGGAAVALVRRVAAERTAALIAESMVEAGYEPPTFSMI